jgi:DNA-binding NarL/FixJ family response regulator
MSIRVVLADDHPVVIEGLEQLFRLEPDITVVGRASNGVEALDLVRKSRPDILVLDLRMPKLDGVAVVRELQQDELPTRIVVLTGIDGEQIQEAIELGVSGVVLKDMAAELLVRAVRQVHAGGTWIERNAATKTVNRLLQRDVATREITAKLTPREIEVARMIAKGLPNKAVADRLRISEGTAKLHLHHVYAKLGLDGRMALARYLQSRGLE